MFDTVCRLCLLPESQENEDSVEERPTCKSGNQIRDVIHKIFGIDLNFGLLKHEKDILCIKCYKYLEIANVMYETVVKAQTHLSEQKFLVVAKDGEIVGETCGVGDSFYEGEEQPMSEDDIKIESPEEPEVPSKPERKPVATIKKVDSKTIEKLVIAQTSHKPTEEQEDEKIAQFFTFACEKCPEVTFSKLGTYKMHMKTEHGQNWAFVTCCGIKFDKRFLLLEHISYHQDPDKFKCPECGSQFTSSKKLGNHQKRIHGPKEQLKYKCQECGKRFLQSGSLKIHMVVHLTKAERDAQTQLICNECGGKFMSKYKLERHMEQVHLNMNLYVCDICAKVYKTKSQYLYHQTTVHTETPQPKVQCTLCGNYFLNEKCLKSHIRGMHSERGHHVCDVCGKVTNTIRAMRSHKRYMHEYQRKFECNVCDKAFKVADALKEHMTRHVGGTLYGCQFCDRTFNSRANMYNHRKKMHPVELARFKAEKQMKNPK